MGYFLDTVSMMGGGDYGLYVPAFTVNDVGKDYAAHTQEPCVIRIAAASNTATETLTATIYTQYGLSGQDWVKVDISLENSLTQYLDITDVLRSGLLRTDATAAYADTATPCYVLFEEFKSGGVSLGTVGFPISAYDSVEPPLEDLQAMLPDTLRMLPSASAAFRAVTVEVSPGYYGIAMSGASPISSTTISPGTDHTIQVAVDTSATQVSVKSNSDTVIAKVIWEPCDSDHMQLRWWSPVNGGWKSCAVKLRGGGYAVGDKADYTVMFDGVGARRGAESVRAVIENCSPADVQYYSDICLSDQVEAYWDGFRPYNKRMKVTGTPPMYSHTGYVDLEFDLQVEEVTSLC